jgi:hypothetical protein
LTGILWFSIELEQSVRAENKNLPFEFPILLSALVLQNHDAWEDWVQSESRQVRKNGHSLGSGDWRGVAEAPSGSLQIEFIDAVADVLVLVKEQSAQDVQELVFGNLTALFLQFGEDSQVRVRSVSNERVEKEYHVVSLDGIRFHDSDEIFKGVVQEEQLG